MSPHLSWLLLLLAGLFEVAWAVGLKYTNGFTRFWPSVGTAVALIVSIGLLAVALRSLPIGTAYAVWVGIGAVGTAVVGIVAFGESASLTRVLSLLLIVAGVAGLKFSTS
ncbi:quaternary ammonium compound efflux SMR transporter SugE [Povalibacter sp.]|uniref:quaternary ammonium compound efflux SMR transporter SugE n=1 Tax=Povalibacter sp. TaxID=1962978 RepID=UPI002F40523E